MLQLPIVGGQLGLGAGLLGDNGLGVGGFPVVLKIFLRGIEDLLHLSDAADHLVVPRLGLVGILASTRCPLPPLLPWRRLLENSCWVALLLVLAARVVV